MLHKGVKWDGNFGSGIVDQEHSGHQLSECFITGVKVLKTPMKRSFFIER